MLNQALAYATAHADQHLQELLDYVSIPSVSAQPAHARDTRYAALWLSEHLRDLGLKADVMETGGNPVVYAEWLGKPGAPTVLIYGHYDVQPAEPLELWHSEPFKPVIRDGFIYGRGSDDNKGQHFAHIKAIESFLKGAGSLPVNVKFLIEGEEEIGGPHLPIFVEKNAGLLACDVVMISDSAMINPTLPAIVYGLRGLVYFEVEARTASGDLHSGTYGGNVQNPAMALAQILAQLKDDHGRITVPGFLDDVRVLSAEERAEMARVPYRDAEILEETGASQVFGDPDFIVAERMGARPTLEVNGIWGGYTGPGQKTVLPALAHAKISCRLVPNQNPDKIYAQVKARMEQLAPPGVTLTFSLAPGSAAGTIVDRTAPEFMAAVRAARATWGAEPIFMLEGGSIPVVNDFQSALKKPVVLLGYGLPGDNIHAPNERFALDCFRKGIEASARFLVELTK